jgi:23S rRNA (guanine745-N1)-methyltransferase
MLCLFVFLVWSKFRRVLSTQGKVIVIDPGPDHLIKLREILYPDVLRSDPTDHGVFRQPEFSVVSKHSLIYENRIIDREQIHNLLTMTPHLYRASPTGRETALARDAIEVTIDVRLRTLGRS